MTLHLLEQVSALRLAGGRLRLEVDGSVIADVPARKVRQVVVHGNVRISTPALRFCLQNGVNVLFTSLEGFLYGWAQGQSSLDPVRLKAQFEAASSPEGLQIARLLVQAKLRSCLVAGRRFAQLGYSVSSHLDEIASSIESAAQATGLDQLRGHEGLGSRAYFACLALALGSYGFSGRHRRPPTDLVNAALSYGYAILLGKVLLALQLAGLHPEIGLLHAQTRRNPALALDLMEEFRVPVVDVVVIQLLRKGALEGLQHSEPRNGGVYLNEPGRKILVRALETRLAESALHPAGFSKPYTDLIETQASLLLAAIVRGKPYTPFSLWR